jgi:hypothetical protein
MKRQKLERVFREKFDLIPSEGSSHRLYYKKYKGEEIFQIPISRGHNDINDDIMREMAQQCYLQLGEFKKSVDCTLPKEKFDLLTIQRWKEKYNKF